MFEQTRKEMIASPWIDQKDSALASQYGIDLPSGSVRLTFAEARELIRRFDLALGGVIYARNKKRFRSIRNQLVYAFGPDMEEALEEI